MAVYGTISIFQSSDDFIIFKERLEQYFVANSIKNEKRVAILITSLSTEVYTTLRDLCSPEAPNAKTYEELCKVLTKQYTRHISTFNERLHFYEAAQAATENVSNWFARIKKLSINCNFGQQLESVLIDKFVSGLLKGKILDRLCEEDPTQKGLESIVDIAVKKEASLKLSSSKSEEIYSTRVKGPVPNRDRGGSSTRIEKLKWKPAKQFEENQRKCYACGKNNHDFSKCTYKSYKCKICGKVGHLATVCKSKKQHFMVVDVQNSGSCEQRDDPCLYNIREDTFNTKDFQVTVTINNVDLIMDIDTGSAISALSLDTYRRYFVELPLSKCSLVLQAYNGSSIKPLGVIEVDFKISNVKRKGKLYIIDKGGPPLLGRDLLTDFKFQIKQLNSIAVTNLNSLLSSFSDLFKDELGLYAFSKIKLNLVPGAIPKFMKPRVLPVAYKEKVELELDRLEKNNVISLIQNSEWGTPLVPIFKKDGSLRLCADYKLTLNKFLEDVKYPLPRIEELFNKLSNGKKFTKLDLSHAYNQLELDESTQCLLSWSTHKGIYKIHRLPFGTKPACAIFQQIIEKTLQGCLGCVVFLDDIVVTGGDDRQHLENLKVVFQRLLDAGFRLRRSKCKFFQDEIKYLGYVINREGLRKDSTKVKAILECPIPENVTQVKSFVGMLNYYCKFIPNVATLLQPLYELLHKDAVFVWSKACNNAFKKTKEIIVSDDVLVHFDATLPIKLACDASSYGIGGVLSHIFPDRTERPICFTSRTLSAAEKNYSMLDKESLAIYYCVKKFSHYLIGNKFTLYTDHKPLTYLFGDKRGVPQMAASRVQRWAVYLNDFHFEIKYVKGTDNFSADCMSRLPLQCNEYSHDEETQYSHLNFIIENGTLPITAEDIKIETQEDPEFKLLYDYVSHGWPNHVKGFPYFNRRSELTMEKGIVMLGHRVVIPAKFRKQLLDELHISHAGVVKMKSKARSYFWWHSIDSDIEKIIYNCHYCNIERANPRKAAVIPYAQTENVFDRIHVDFFGPIQSKMFLIMVDSYSRWPEVFILSGTNASITIDVLRTVFARFGIPKQIVSDNGPQFVSDIFQDFCKRNGIKHSRIAPYHPASNGAAENAVKSVKRGIKKSLNDKRNSNISLNTIVARYLLEYRTTPHCATGETPSYRMFGRQIPTRFDALKPSLAKQKFIDSAITEGREEIFKEGDRVYVRDYRANETKWVKSTIVEVKGSRTYLCKVDNTDLIWKRHLDQMYKNREKVDDSLNKKDEVQNVDSSPTEAIRDNHYNVTQLCRPRITDDINVRDVINVSDVLNVNEVNVSNPVGSSRPKRAVRKPNKLDL
uniref:RNA-directed DNA polymerase n=3 Tax=Photinus pyralis TaxID=7054 RepID=A0A1Y1N2I4_PHOPY